MKEIERIHQRPQTRVVRLPPILPIGQGQRPPGRAGGQRQRPGGQLQIIGHAMRIQHRPQRIGGQGQGQGQGQWPQTPSTAANTPTGGRR